MVDPNKYPFFEAEPTDLRPVGELLGGIIGSLRAGEPPDTEPGRNLAAHITDQLRHVTFLEEQLADAKASSNGEMMAYWEGKIATANTELHALQQGYLPWPDSAIQ